MADVKKIKYVIPVFMYINARHRSGVMTTMVIRLFLSFTSGGNKNIRGSVESATDPS